MGKNWHYYESHITIEPVRGKRLELFKRICNMNKYRVADLLMRKGKRLAKSDKDSFCTSRDDSIETLIRRMVHVVGTLTGNGFKVYRYKIESVIIDSRYDDELLLLES